jgi:hypothetical protein
VSDQSGDRPWVVVSGGNDDDDDDDGHDVAAAAFDKTFALVEYCKEMYSKRPDGVGRPGGPHVISEPSTC